MTDRDDTNDTVNNEEEGRQSAHGAEDAEPQDAGESPAEAESTADGGEAEPSWRRLFRRDGEPQSEVEAEVRRRFEEEAAEILQRLLGVPINEDGTPDVSDLTQEELDESMPQLAIELLKAYMRAIRPVLQERREQYREGDEDEAVSDEEFFTNAAEDIRLVLSLFGERPGGFAATFEELAVRVKDALNEQLSEVMKKMNIAQSLFDSNVLTKDNLKRVLGARLVGLVRRLGDAVEASRVPRPGTLAAESSSRRAAPRVEREAGSGDVETGEKGELEEGEEEEGGEVIILEEVRKKFEEKRKQIEGLPDILSRFLINTGATDQADAININLDQDFIKEHGPSLLKQLFDGLSKTLIPPKVELNLPMTPEEQQAEQRETESDEAADDDAETGTPEDPSVKVSVNLDLGSILGKLFRPTEK